MSSASTSTSDHLRALAKSLEEKENQQEAQNKLLESLLSRISSLETKHQQLINEKNEIDKRFVEQQSVQETQDILLKSLHKRIDSLDDKNQQLINENAELKASLESVKTDHEKHFDQQQSIQLAQDNLQSKVDSIEIENQRLIRENDELKERLKTSNERMDEISKEVSQAGRDIHDYKEWIRDIHDYKKWIRLVAVLSDEIRTLRHSDEKTDEKMKEIMDNQNDIAEQVRQLETQLTQASSSNHLLNNSFSNIQSHYRVPVRSPSTSSYFNNGNNHIYSRINSSSTRKMNKSFDANEEAHLSDISDQAESLIGDIGELNDLHRRSLGKY